MLVRHVDLLISLLPLFCFAICVLHHSHSHNLSVSYDYDCIKLLFVTLTPTLSNVLITASSSSPSLVLSGRPTSSTDSRLEYSSCSAIRFSMAIILVVRLSCELYFTLSNPNFFSSSFILVLLYSSFLLALLLLVPVLVLLSKISDAFFILSLVLTVDLDFFL